MSFDCPESLVRVVAPHFVAGLIMAGNRCTEAAPILKWAIGKDRAELRAYFARKSWRASILTQAFTPRSPAR